MKIQITKDGPYSVDGEIPVSDVISIGSDEDEGVLNYEVKKAHEKTDANKFFCRCGHSKNKPYCDGTHAKVHFDGTETDNRIPYDDEAVLVEGPVFDALDNQKLCAVARFCDRGDGFWYAFEHAHRSGNEKYAEEVGCKCSSGRFTLVDKKTGKKLEPELEKEVYLVIDGPAECYGPIYAKGGIQIIGADGFEYDVRNRVTLCRCGESRNKPFCDGTHLNCPHMQV